MTMKKLFFLSLFLFLQNLLYARELQWDWSTIDPTQIYFPPNFYWGVADSAMQTEGIVTANNKTITNSWTEYENQQMFYGIQEKVGSACERWTRYKEDIQLMKQCG